jgi:hypothetical protein
MPVRRVFSVVPRGLGRHPPDRYGDDAERDGAECSAKYSVGYRIAASVECN